LKINLVGLGIGDGFMSPPDSSVYADYLFQLALVGETERDEMLKMEENMKNQCANGNWESAWRVNCFI
jgi:hypothetical protein